MGTNPRPPEANAPAPCYVSPSNAPKTQYVLLDGGDYITIPSQGEEISGNRL